MPEHGANAVRKFRLLQTPQEPAVDGGHVRRVGLVALVLINTCSALGPIENADRDLVGFDERLTQLDPPIANLVMMMIWASVERQGIAPDCVPGPVLVRARRTEAAQPGATVRMDDALVRPGFGIGLALNDEDVTTN